jgi:hypothetical protein
MRIAIIEVSEPNHYSAVNGLIKTYSSIQTNQVIVYTLPSIKVALEENGLPSNASIVTLSDRQSPARLLASIEQTKFDRIHICTIFDNFTEFSQFKPNAQAIFLHIHQCEEWYNDTLNRAIKNLFLNLKYKDQNRKYHRIIARSLIDLFVFRPQRKKIIANYNANYKFSLIVHSKGQQETLLKYSCRHPIIVFPFAIYEGMADAALPGQPLKICIPGIISQAKRDYLGLFESLKAHRNGLQEKISLHLLGYISDREKDEMQRAISALVAFGYKVVYHQSFVYGEEFDQAIASCDLLLNNQFISKNNTEVYGKTKESGMIFNMLRAAKPGLLPRQYQVSQEFHDSTVFFDDYGDLIQAIEMLARDRKLLNDLSTSAKQLSERYLPDNLYPRLVPDMSHNPQPISLSQRQ